MSLIWNSAGDTHPGKRRSSNQDTVLERAQDGLWMVADGMGGHHAGEFASASIASGLRNLALCEHLSDCVDQVDDTLIRIN
ncbi:MAG: serine/threonine-protein phosphatase, partial [Proteobacteria bacterium]|nr:serine/threonine-protein phosphatase [Pseudomonadota bacterium]